MIRCKVRVRVTVQVNQQTYRDDDQPLRDMFRSVASDAIGKVHRALSGLDEVVIVGEPLVDSILTDEVTVVPGGAG